MNIRKNLIFKSCFLIFGIIFSIFFTVLKTNEVQAVAACSQWYGPDMYLTITDQSSGQVYGTFSAQDDDGDGDTLYNDSITVPYGAILRFESRSVMPFNYGSGAHTLTIHFPYQRNDIYTGVALAQTRTNYSDAMDNGSSFYTFISSSGCDTGSESYSSVGDMNITINVQAPPTPAPITGCMDPAANNYNPSATVSDGSCAYVGNIYVVSRDSSGNPISTWWTITGPANYSGSGTSGAYTNAPTGTYSISAGGISGYSGPVITPNSTQGLNANSSITFTLTYTLNSTPPPPPPPGSGSPPGSFTLNNTSCQAPNTIPLSWSASANATSYEIYEKQGSGGWSYLTATGGTSYNVSNRPYNTDLYYYIKATNSYGSTDSNQIYGGNCPSVPPPPGACSVDTFTADNVTNLSLSYPNSGATLRWNTTGASTLTGSNAWSGSKNIPTGSQSTGALAVGTYTYVLSCTASGGNNSKSVTVSVSTPPPPPGNGKVIVSVPSCAIGGEYVAYIGWSGINSDPTYGYFADVSTDQNFGTLWNTRVPYSPGATSGGVETSVLTCDSGNFCPGTPPGESLPLKGGKTYYARVWAGQHYPNSGPVSFSVPNCPAPPDKPTTPVWSGQPVCVVPTGVYNANISWTGVHNTTDLGGFGTYIDIDEDSNWDDAGLYDWWNRNIPKNDSSRTVNTGGSSFRGFWPNQDNILNGLRPGVSYYARAYNGYPQWGVHSDTSAELNVPACTLNGTLTASPSTGTGPLSVTLTATRTSGTAPGLITYQFDCRNDGTFDWTAGPQSSTVSTYTCSYPSSSTPYSAKVRITQTDALGQSMYVEPTTQITSNFVCGNLTQSCNSQPNVCGQTNTGTQTRTCDPNTGVTSDWGACSATPPPNSSCPASVPSVSCNPSTVSYNGSSTVSWSCTNSTSSRVVPGNWPGTCTNGTCSGSQSTGALTSNQTYTVTCTGYNGSNTTASCPVTVSGPSVSISANPTSVNYNSSTTISWTVANASSCTGSNGSSGWAGSRNSSTGTHSWTSGGLTSNQTYTITCSGANGASAGPVSASVTVSAPTVTISNNQTLPWNSSPTISWTPANAGSCTATGGTTGWAGGKTATNGTHSWTSSSGITTPGIYVYSIQCFGNGQTEVKNSFVTIDPPVPSTPTNVAYQHPDYCQSGPGGFVKNWTYSDPSGSPQTAYQVQIDEQGSFQEPEYDSGKLNSSSNVFAVPNNVLQFNKGYRARVRVWNSYDVVSAWSNPTDTFNTPNYAYPNVIPPYQFTWPTPPKPQKDKPVQFTDRAVFGGGNENNRQWVWNFGDGGSLTCNNISCKSPAHTYTAVGNYTVTETVTDAGGQTCSYSQSVEVIKPIPVIKEVAPR